MQTPSQPTQPETFPASAACGQPALNGDLYDQLIDDVLSRCWRYLLAQPALVLTLSYLFCSLLGMLFVTSLFNQFDFDVLPYLEVSDFILAAVSHPWTLGYFLFCCVVVVVMFWLDRQVRQRFRRFARWVDLFYRPESYNATVCCFALIPMLFFFNSAFLEAKALASRIKANQQPQFQISLINPLQDLQQTRRLEQAQVLARTVSYLFVYHQQQIKVIPHANVAALLPVTPAVPVADLQPPASVTKPAATKPTATEPNATQPNTTEPDTTQASGQSEKPATHPTPHH